MDVPRNEVEALSRRLEQAVEADGAASTRAQALADAVIAAVERRERRRAWQQ